MAPVTRDVLALHEALRSRGTVVIYKGGRRHGELGSVIAECGTLDRSVRMPSILARPDARVLPPSIAMSEVDSEVAEAAP